MRLTRKKAIELCIELWTWCAETGKRKEDWPRWSEIEEKYGDILASCFFCEYNDQQERRYDNKAEVGCCYCPLKKVGLGCGKHNGPYQKWAEAKTPRTRKKYAKLFLEQIKSI